MESKWPALFVFYVLVLEALMPSPAFSKVPARPGPDPYGPKRVEVSTAPNYPQAIGDTQSFEQISNVRVSFTSSTVTLSVDVAIKNGILDSYQNGEFLNAWIDWNGDQVFTDDERIMHQFQVPSSAPGSITFTVTSPIPQVKGFLPFYMRVILAYGIDQPSSGEWERGSVRDFLILDVNSEPQPSPTDLKVGLDYKSETVSDMAHIWTIVNPNAFKPQTATSVLYEDGNEIAHKDFPVAPGDHKVTFAAGRQLDFTKKYTIKAFIDRNTPKEKLSKNEFDLTLFRLRITAPADATILTITPAPAMPVINATVKVEGLNPDPTPTTNFNWGIRVRYTDHGRNDETTVQQQNVQGGNWTPNFQTDIVGGKVKLVVLAIVENQKVNAIKFESDGIEINGSNPTKAAMKGRLGAVENQVIGYRESTFRQFLQNGQPVFGTPKGFGIMQLDTPAPTKTQIWNWQENIDQGLNIIGQKKAAARTFENKEISQKGATAFTANQFQLEWWQRYNGGRHWKGWINGQWVKQPNTGYSDAVNGIFQQVEAGTPPAGWND
jgi:hypothetical protein